MKDKNISEEYKRAREIVNTLSDDGDRIFMHRIINRAFPLEDLLEDDEDEMEN